MRNLYNLQYQTCHTAHRRSISSFTITINQIPGFFAGIATQKDNIGQHFCIYRPNILNIKNNPKVEFEDENRINWIYLADGTKLRKTFFDNTKNEVTDYSGSFIYTKKANLARKLDYITTADGRITNESGVLKYEYHLKDHLGNTRLAINEDLDLDPEKASWRNEVSNLFYYPFGVSYAPSNSNKDIRYKYNGKEHDNDNNLNWYHYGVRFYDPEIGRWHTMDPADEFHSPYVYAGNDPINNIDPDGAENIKAVEARVNYINKGMSYGIAFDYKNGKRVKLDRFVCNEYAYQLYSDSGIKNFPLSREPQIKWFKNRKYWKENQSEGEVGDLLYFKSHVAIIIDIKVENGEVKYAISDAGSSKHKVNDRMKNGELLYKTIAAWSSRIYFKSFIGIGSIGNQPSGPRGTVEVGPLFDPKIIN